jgi:hypothetical protein
VRWCGALAARASAEAKLRNARLEKALAKYDDTLSLAQTKTADEAG